ncbi:hypothetical protein EJB05_27203, partial [Eragrostis curvula]
ELFADYSDFCFKTFGDRPRIVALLGYDGGSIPPQRCTKCAAGGNSATEPYIVAHNFLSSHATAVARYRTKYQAAQKGKVGIVLDFTWYKALTNSTEVQAAAQRARDFHIWFVDPLINGYYPQIMQDLVKERLPRARKLLQQTPTSYSADWQVSGLWDYFRYCHFNDPRLNCAAVRNGKPIGPQANSDWLRIVPWGMYGCVNYLNEKYGNPTVYITENEMNKSIFLFPGMDQPGNLTCNQYLRDVTRVRFYKSYLTELKKAIDKGANVAGYFAWSFLDNFEWQAGYTSKFGIVYVDFNNTLERHPKASAYWFRDMLQH